MKIKIYITLIILLIGTLAMAQPLPPTTPYGNPVPIGGLAGILLAFGAFFLIKKNKK